MSVATIAAKSLWIEKYRPRSIEDIILNPEIKEKAKEWIKNPKLMPNLILVGSPGSGKTSLSSIFINHIIKNKDDFMYINGSSDRGIQNIREVGDFVRYNPIYSPVKIVFIDEADNLTLDSFKALRGTMEINQDLNKFIFTGNYDVFPEYLKSRCYTIKMYEMPYDKVLELTKSILKNENIRYSENFLLKVVDIYYPDLRKIINTLQSISKNGTLDIDLLDKNVDEKDRLVMLLFNVIENSRVTKEEADEILYYTLLTVKKDKRRDVGVYVLERLLSKMERKMEEEKFDVRKYYNLYMLTLKYQQEIRNASANIAALMEYIWEILNFWKIIYVE